MSDQYMKELLRIAVAQICQTIGYNATQTAPLELLQDVLDKFMKEFTRDLRRQVEHYNRTDANLNDVALTLNSINVNLNELLDYINNVEPVPFALEIPKFPARKDSALNFLKPGSQEVLTRPVHVHDHLPPMLPPEITHPLEPPSAGTPNVLSEIKSFPDNLINTAINTTGDLNNDTSNKSLNPAAVLDKNTLQSLFKPTNFEDGERPTREVSSVVMTTGGFISPAVEGKMPEAIVPDIIDKLLGLDAPPPPAPPQPPQAISASRSTNSTPVPVVGETSAADRDSSDVSTNKDTKKSLSRNTETHSISNKKLELLNDFQAKKSKLFNAALGKSYSQDANVQVTGNYKKSYMMHQNAANMLLKKAKKQKIPLIPAQPGIMEKHNKPHNDKVGKMDTADKAHRKYMKMLQKMAKQGKIQPELLNNIMGSDKKSKLINPAIVAAMPIGPEKLQLEKLLRKQAKQRQKIIKQQMMAEVQKKSKKPLQQLPPLVPIFPARTGESSNKPLQINLEDQKLKQESKNVANISPVKSSYTSSVVGPISLVGQIPAVNETFAVDGMDVSTKPIVGQDGKEFKLSNEPDRSKLNIFKKISKQKTPKSSSPTSIRVPGNSDAPIINLPSGTTITPAVGPSIPTSSSSVVTASPVGRNLFPPVLESNVVGPTTNITNVDSGKDKQVPPPTNSNQPTDLSMLNRVFGEKPIEAELVNKPKKRGRKPGSKNSPKIPGLFPNNLLKKNNKKMKLNNSNMFNPQIPPQLPPDLAAAGMSNVPFDNMAQLFANPLNPMDWTQKKNLQQQAMMMPSTKERKEHKKKSKILKQDFLNNEKNITNMSNLTNVSHINVPTNEEVQSINKKLMRMDTILKAAPATASSLTDLTIDTSLITGKKLPSPSMFPSSASPLKSPGNSKRMVGTGTEGIASSLVQPFMLPNRPAFPNLPSNMLSMLQFPFPTRPGLIPTPGLFPTPGLGTFPNNPKNPLLPGLFPFPNLKQTLGDNTSMDQESDDLTADKKKLELNLQPTERSYCNVAPLVPDFLTKLKDPNSNGGINKHSHDQSHIHEPDLPKTPKPRSSLPNTVSQAEVHTPESATGSLSGKSIPSTPGGISVNTFEQLMKKNDSPIDLKALNKHSKLLSASQESGLDFSMNKKPINNANIGSMSGCTLSVKTPITLNNEPIEVSDDSDETNQPQPSAPERRQVSHPPPASQQVQPTTHHNTFKMDDMFVANTTSHLLTKPIESDLSIKEMKKLKKQVKKSSSSISTNLISTEKPDGITSNAGSVGGVGKLAGGADLIPLSSTGLAYSAKNIPYNSLTANANPSFHIHKVDFSNTAAGSSSATTHSSASVFDNLTITAAVPLPSGTSSNTIYDLQKKRKEHKKLKKLKEIKEGKIKKKKDKKDKNKSKDRTEKYLLNQTQLSTSKEKGLSTLIEPITNVAPVLAPTIGGNVSEKVKDKDLLKKLKKEKKKEKQRTVLEELAPPQHSSVAQQIAGLNTFTHKEGIPPSSVKGMTTPDTEQQVKKQKSPALNYSVPSSSEHRECSLTISTAATTSASIIPKLTLKLGSTHSPTPPREETHKSNSTSSSIPIPKLPSSSCTPPREREPSPELARISPLVTRPPKHKLNPNVELANASSNANTGISAGMSSSLETSDGSKAGSASNSNIIVPPPSPWLSGGTISASSVLLPHQLLQSTKHDMTTTPITVAHNTDSIVKTANVDRQSPLTLITETSRPSSYIDAEGNRVWICPACGKVDDGSPMIGCDGCDAWYHWVCVGIFVAPKDNEDWFCRVCITRKKGLHSADKKRKRNKKK